MTIYEKLQQVRVALQNENIKKSGKNTFAGYDYYELKDFLPAINRLCLEKGITTIVDFSGAENITLAIIDFEKPEDRILFYSPRTDAAVKGAQTIQNLGATETYQRRYLYLMAFEIAESDTVDATQGREGSQRNNQSDSSKNKTTTQRSTDGTNEKTINEGHVKSLLAKGAKISLSDADLNSIASWKFNVKDIRQLSVSSFAEMMNKLPELWDGFLKEQ